MWNMDPDLTGTHMIRGTRSGNARATYETEFRDRCSNTRDDAQATDPKVNAMPHSFIRFHESGCFDAVTRSYAMLTYSTTMNAMQFEAGWAGARWCRH